MRLCSLGYGDCGLTRLVSVEVTAVNIHVFLLSDYGLLCMRTLCVS